MYYHLIHACLSLCGILYWVFVFPMTKNIIAECVNGKDLDVGNIIPFNNFL